MTADVYHQRGTVLHQLKRFGEARDDFARALRARPRNAVVWNLRGLCDAQLGDVAARAARTRARRGSDARFKEAWANLAQLERDAGRGEAALDGFDAALARSTRATRTRACSRPRACTRSATCARARQEAARAPANHLECAQQVSPRSPRAARARAAARRGRRRGPPLSLAQVALCLHARGADIADADAAARARARRGRRRRRRGGGADDGGGAPRSARARRRRGRARQRVQRHRRGAGALHHAYLRALSLVNARARARVARNCAAKWARLTRALATRRF